MSKDIVTTQSNGVYIRQYTPQQVQLIKDTICKKATDDELELFLYTAQRTGLDPLARQIYAIKRWDSNLRREAMAIQTSIDGFRIVAQRSRDYAGQSGPYWCGADGVWRDVWLEKTPPRAAKVGVLRAGFKEPLYAVALWDEYVQTYKDKDTGQVKVSTFWQKMPALMLAKVAESLALRKGFPQDLSGIYTSEEMSQAGNAGAEEEGTDYNNSPLVVPTTIAVPNKPQATTTSINPTSGDTHVGPQVVSEPTARRWKPSAAQLKRLYAIATRYGWGGNSRQELMVKMTGCTEEENLTREQYDHLCHYMQRTPNVQQAHALPRDAYDEAQLDIQGE